MTKEIRPPIQRGFRGGDMTRNRKWQTGGQWGRGQRGTLRSIRPPVSISDKCVELFNGDELHCAKRDSVTCCIVSYGPTVRLWTNQIIRKTTTEKISEVWSECVLPQRLLMYCDIRLSTVGRGERCEVRWWRVVNGLCVTHPHPRCSLCSYHTSHSRLHFHSMPTHLLQPMLLLMCQKDVTVF